jgi:serine/threonine-protein kinase
MPGRDSSLVKYCPICRAKFTADVDVCPNDGMRLFDRLDPLIGKILDRRYQILEKIGSGGMAAVFKVEDLQVERVRAMKILFPKLAEDSTHRVRFLREATAARSIEHENVVEVFELGETDNGLVYMVMEYLEGPTLSQTISRGPMPLGRVVRILIQLVSALGRAHELGIVHRDIKPDNIILVNRDGRDDHVKILDFGLARMQGDLRLTATGQVFGTPEYIAPERASGEPAIPASDQYAAGVLFYELLTGRPPFVGAAAQVLLSHFKQPPTPPSERGGRRGISAEFDRVVLRMLAKLPVERYPNAASLIAELESLLAGLGETR